MKKTITTKTCTMKNSTKPSVLCKGLIIAFICSFCFSSAWAQIPPNAVNADPAAKAISQVPLGSTIVGNGVLRFRFVNEATSTNNTGQIPANSVRLTISFPGAYAYTSVSNIPKFVVEDADDNPYGVVHLVNNELILEDESVDLELNVRAISNGAGSVTFNADRVSPITVANALTGNDNSSALFSAALPLPVTIVDFNAQKNNCTAKLKWTAHNETNIDKYTVECSKDNGLTYQSVGMVNAQSGHGETGYEFSHQMTDAKAYFYRIKIIEQSGAIAYSNVAIINSGCGNGRSWSLYPTIAANEVTIQFSDNAQINTRATILDAAGRVYSIATIKNNTEKINISKLSAGLYIIKLQDGSIARFIKE